MNPIFVIPVKQCIQLIFPFKKFFENRRTIVQRISRFWPSHGFLLKYNCPYRNLTEIPKMWIILINNQHLMEKSAFLGLFDNEMCYNSVTTEPTSKWTLFSCFPWNSAYSSCFSLKNSKIFENRRTIVQRISRFWPDHGFLLKHNCPYQNLMEITKMWTILINNQHLRKKSAFFCFFRQKMQQVINYWAYAKRTPRTAINAFLLSKFFSFINRVSREAWFRSRSLADITTAREGAYRPGGSGGDGFGERDWSYKPCGCTAWR